MILCSLLSRNFRIVQFGANWQTPICPKWLAIWGPKYMSPQFFHKTDPLKLEFYVKVDHKYSPLCGYYVDILVYNCPNEQQLQGGLTFATQISPLLNFNYYWISWLMFNYPNNFYNLVFHTLNKSKSFHLPLKLIVVNNFGSLNWLNLLIVLIVKGVYSECPKSRWTSVQMSDNSHTTSTLA